MDAADVLECYNAGRDAGLDPLELLYVTYGEDGLIWGGNIELYGIPW